MYNFSQNNVPRVLRDGLVAKSPVGRKLGDEHKLRNLSIGADHMHRAYPSVAAICGPQCITDRASFSAWQLGA